MSRRIWVKIHCQKWLYGSLRKESAALRGTFSDILALAGDSELGENGEISLGEDVGFTDEIIAGMFSIPLSEWMEHKERLMNHPNPKENRICIKPLKIGYKIVIINFPLYQAEYPRQRDYKKEYKERLRRKKEDKKRL